EDGIRDFHVTGVQTCALPILFGGGYRYTERRMHEDDLLYAIGYFQTRSSHHEPLQRTRETAALLAAWKRDQAGLLARFDADASGDRKSTRLNSSHVKTSYAVF